MDAVVVGVDGSDAAAHALRVGAELATSVGAGLVPVHVEHLPPGVIAAPTAAVGSLLAANAEVTDAVHVECELILASHGGPWCFEVTQGDVASELARAAERHGAGVVVVGHSRHRLPRVGTSVIDRLIRRSAASVLVVPSAARTT